MTSPCALCKGTDSIARVLLIVCRKLQFVETRNSKEVLTDLDFALIASSHFM